MAPAAGVGVGRYRAGEGHADGLSAWPQSPQKRAPGRFSAPQSGQPGARLAPHWSQKRRPAVFSAEHFAQVMMTGLSPSPTQVGQGTRNAATRTSRRVSVPAVRAGASRPQTRADPAPPASRMAEPGSMMPSSATRPLRGRVEVVAVRPEEVRPEEVGPEEVARSRPGAWVDGPGHPRPGAWVDGPVDPIPLRAERAHSPVVGGPLAAEPSAGRAVEERVAQRPLEEQLLAVGAQTRVGRAEAQQVAWPARSDQRPEAARPTNPRSDAGLRRQRCRAARAHGWDAQTA